MPGVVSGFDLYTKIVAILSRKDAERVFVRDVVSGSYLYTKMVVGIKD